MALLWEWIQNNGSALMVVITFVYVIATICIFVANNKSVKATREQLKESKRQFSESQRLSVLPFISATIGETVYPTGTPLPFPDIHVRLVVKDSYQDDRLAWVSCGLTLNNIGIGMACNMQADWLTDNHSIPQALKTTVLCSNHSYLLNITIMAEQADNLYSHKGALVLRFSDIAGNTYTQELIFNCSVRPFCQDVSIDTFQVMEPELVVDDEEK